MSDPFPDPALIRPLAQMAWLVGLLAWETWRPFFGFFQADWRARGAHGLRNFAFALLNGALIAICFSMLWAGAAAWSARHAWGLLHRLDMPLWAHALAAILLLDILTYGWHRANHRLPWLWRFHRMHHSDLRMDVTTAHRFHPGEILMSSALRVPLIALVGVHLWELIVYEFLLAVIVEFHHANIGLPAPVDRALRLVIVTPAMHKVHHSQERLETDSNYTSLLSVWDRVFGSFRLRTDPSSIRLGLADWSPPLYKDSVTRMLATPLRDTSRR